MNISDEEVNARKDYTVKGIAFEVSDKLLNKFRSTCEQAARQLNAYCLLSDVKKIVYLVINFDDILHEYSGNYSAQIEKYIAEHTLPNIEVVIDIKPPFYYATA
jgi:predicted DNA-binding ArsR family transcriptional regulator